MSAGRAKKRPEVICKGTAGQRAAKHRRGFAERSKGGASQGFDMTCYGNAECRGATHGHRMASNGIEWNSIEEQWKAQGSELHITEVQMTVTEIDDLARNKADISNSCTIPETGLYYKLRAIYTAYDEKQITAKQAKKQKADVIEEYEHEIGKDSEIAELTSRIEQHIRIFAEQDKRQMSIELALSDAQKNGCEKCRKLVAALDGWEI